MSLKGKDSCRRTGELLQQVQRGAWRPPSQVKANTPPALDAICRKAMALQPQDRYATALDLAADVEHWLADEPVSAYREPWSVRTRRSMRRHRTLVTGVAAASLVGLVALTGGLIVMTGLNRQLAAANTNERQAREQAEKVLEFVEKRVFAAARPEGLEGGLGHAVTLRQAIEAALPFVAKSFTDQPLIEARLRMTLGTSFESLGDAKAAAKQEEAARALYARHRGPDHPDTLASMNNLAVSYNDLGRYADAVKLNEETLALRKAKLGADHPDTLASMNNLAQSFIRLGRYADAVELLEETLTLKKTKLGLDHAFTLLTMNDLAICYRDIGRHADAVKLFEETLALQKTKLGPVHPYTLSSMNNLANTYSALGQHAKALKLHRETLALHKAKLGPDHPMTLNSMHNLAKTYSALGQYTNALKLFEETLALRKAKLGPDHPDTLQSMNSLANSYTVVGRYEDALKLDQESLAFMKAKNGPHHPYTLRSMNNLANSYHILGRHADAVKLLEETLALQQAKLGPDHRDTLPTMGTLASSYAALGRHAEALKLCRQTTTMLESLNRTDPHSLYNAACMRAVTSAVLRAADPSPAGTKQADTEAEQAMVWLKKAVAAGYKDAASMQKDKDLDALRDREDFKKLLAELATDAAGAAKKK